jgi:hypothetical protein
MLSALPTHTQVRLVFDFIPIDSWDGGNDGSGDTFGFNFDGQNPSSWTFSNFGGFQTFPLSPDVQTNFLFNAGWPESIYRDLEQTISHSGGDLTINFFGQNLQDINDESWAIDNVRVFLDSAAPGG